MPAEPYLSALDLSGRVVVVVGGGVVAERRTARLLLAGARIRLIAPRVETSLSALGSDGRLDWTQRDYRAGDLAGAWYVLAATDDPLVNARVVEEASAQQTFCVRCDDAGGSTAWTPATATEGDVQIGVVSLDAAGHGDPRRTRTLRDALARHLHQLLEISS